MSTYAASSYQASGPYQQAGYGTSPYGRSKSPANRNYGGTGGGGSSSYYSSNGGNNNYYGGNSNMRGNSSGGYQRGGDRGNSNFGSGLVPVDWKSVTLAPIKKDFYRESPTVAQMSREDGEKLRAVNEIRIISGGPAPNPVVRFEDAGFPAEILSKLYQAGFDKPSPIQTQAWPVLLSGRDMIGIAETGSGKTLAFLLPAAVHIAAQERIRPDEGPIALVLAPTRELVEQIKEESVKFLQKIRTGVAYGGAPKRMQIQTLRNGCEIVAACPGRLIDFLERGTLNLRRVTYLVLDEADRMLDMGFEPQIRKIVVQIRPDRQTLMFSATWPKEVQGLARDLCKEDPVHVTIGSTDLKASHNVEQKVEVVSDLQKKQKVFELLTRLQEEDNGQRVIIFTETKRAADILTRELRQSGFPALGIHGDKEQDERKYVLEEFKLGRHPIMIATDVASRGLDVKDVKVVINYDMPNQIEDYVHRIGRTGRAGATGVSYSFLTPDKARLAKDLIRIMQEANQKISRELQELSYTASKSGGGGRGYGAQRRYGGYNRYGGGGGGYHSTPYSGSNAVSVAYGGANNGGRA